MNIDMGKACASRALAVIGIIILSATLVSCISTDAAKDRADAIDLADDRLPDGDLSVPLAADPTDLPAGWPTEVSLDPDEAVRIAMSRDVAVRKALADIDRMRAGLAQADRAPNPMIQVAFGIPIDGMTGAPAMAALVQQLTWLWTRPHRLSAADAERQASIFSAGDAIISLDAEVRRRHAAAVNASRRAAVDRDHADSTNRLSRVLETLLEIGESSRIDLDRALVESSEARIAAEASESSARISRLDLLAAMGLPDADPDFTLVPDDVDDPDAMLLSESLIADLAATARLDVAASGCRILATEARMGLAETRRLPEVEAALAWNRNFVEREAVLPGVKMSIPILDDGSPAIAAAAADLMLANLDLLQTRRRAIAEARNARERLVQATQRRVGYDQSVLEPAARAENLAVEAFDEGVVDLTVVLLAQRRRIEAERRALQFRLDEVVARVDLLESVGGSFEIAPEPPILPELDHESPTGRLTSAGATP